MALQGEIVVTAKQLEQQAGVVRTQLSEMKRHFDTLKRRMDATRSYWKGEAGDAHRNSYLTRIQRIETMLRRYEEHIRDLEVMAGIYTRSEELARQVAEQMPVSEL